MEYSLHLDGKQIWTGDDYAEGLRRWRESHDGRYLILKKGPEDFWIAALAEGSTAEARAKGSTAEARAKGSTAKAWAKGSTAEARAKGSTAEAWAKGSTAKAWAEGSTAKAWAEGSTAKALAEGSTAKALAEGSTAEARAKGSTAEAWAEGSTAEAWAEGSTAEAWAKGSTAKAWAEGSTAEARAKGSTAEACTDGAMMIDSVGSVHGADEYYKAAVTEVFDFLPNEVAGLKKALIEGRINGSLYTGECACLYGTLAKVRGCDYTQLGVKKNMGIQNREELLFLSLRPGMTPENDPLTRHIVGWINEWESARVWCVMLATIPVRLQNPKTMREKQSLFAFLIATLMLDAYAMGYDLTCEDFHAWPEDGRHQITPPSVHYDKLAADLNLYKGGKWLNGTADHTPLGQRWISYHPLCRWGGQFPKPDGNHYSLTDSWRA